MRSWKYISLLIHLLTPANVSSFIPSQAEIQKRHGRLVAQGNNIENSFDDGSSVGFFEMKQIPTATSGSRLDYIVSCSESGECNVEEMAAMIEELEMLNDQCIDATGSSRECNLDAIAARNVLKVALASKVVLQKKQQQQQNLTNDSDLQSLTNPFSELHNMNDECMHNLIHTIPSSTAKESSDSKIRLDRIVECAEAGDCPVGEIADMIDELERLNAECESALSRECTLDAVEARNILKVALGAQAAAARETNAMVARRLYEKQNKE